MNKHILPRDRTPLPCAVAIREHGVANYAADVIIFVGFQQDALIAGVFSETVLN